MREKRPVKEMANSYIQRLNAEKVLENLYLLVMAVFVSYMFLGTTQVAVNWPDQFYNKMMTVLLGLVLARICFSKQYSLKETITAVLISAVLYYASKMNGYSELYYLMIMILGAKGIYAKKLIKVYFSVTVTLLIYTIVSSLLGYTENLVYYQENRRARMALGTVYPTDLSAHVFYSTLCYVFIRDEKIRWFDVAGIVIVAILTFLTTDARMNFLCTLLFAAGLIIYLFYKRKTADEDSRIELPGWISYIFVLFPVLCAGVMITLTTFYTPDFAPFRLLNRILNNRLYYGKLGVDVYGFSRWGQYIEMMGNGGSTAKKSFYFFLDCSYVSGLLRWGGIAFAVILIMMLMLSAKARMEKKWVYLWIFVIISVQCIIEHHLIETAYNPFFWLLLAQWQEKGSRTSGLMQSIRRSSRQKWRLR